MPVPPCPRRLRLFHPLFPLLLLLADPGAAAPPTAVIVATAEHAELAERVEALGTLRANESVVITSTVTETVAALHFDDGQRVEQGALLVELTSAEQQALLEEARARRAEAERQYRRVNALVAQDSAAESLLDERQRDLETSRAVLVALESRLADRVIRAPFAGVLGLRQVSPGALVEPGDPITTLDDDAEMKLDFTVPSRYLAGLTPGLRVEARTRAYGETVFVGRVGSVDSRVDPVTRAVLVRAILPNPERRLRPGLLMRLELLFDPRTAVVIPEAALLQRGQRHFVMVVTEAPTGELLAERREVQIGIRRPGRVEIRAGLKTGERVITEGHQRVRPGAPVRILAVDDDETPLQTLLEGSAA
ncbi:efflux RND transporter periplasmic adaptor subunit [Marichromatium bheemlicum]|uniref:Efflux RND transporter periplasmic adaptor subunit n=1 Tax=Marichromatium bheemlicum TaxID=365339 RepID=A0ABX1IBX8_9GAMM|nr:efflux RND transporter periplasmic adaptor subunit [Marichromatium bheemlicum]NKN33606.1 efflux RND transporter periplasmic adaptor subunit [Marichromatium bheemlicum]